MLSHQEDVLRPFWRFLIFILKFSPSAPPPLHPPHPPNQSGKRNIIVNGVGGGGQRGYGNNDFLLTYG